VENIQCLPKFRGCLQSVKRTKNKQNGFHKEEEKRGKQMTIYYFLFSLFTVFYANLWYVLGWTKKEEKRKYLFYVILALFLVSSILSTLWSEQFTLELPLTLGTTDLSEMAYYAFILTVTISGMILLLHKLLKYSLEYSMFLSTMTAYGFIELSGVPTYFKTLLLAQDSMQVLVILGLTILYLYPVFIAILEISKHNLYVLVPVFWFYVAYCLVLLLALFSGFSWLLDNQKEYFLIQWNYVFKILFVGIALSILQFLRPDIKKPKIIRIILVAIIVFLISIPLQLLWG
jgi:hypothetical protein